MNKENPPDEKTLKGQNLEKLMKLQEMLHTGKGGMSNISRFNPGLMTKSKLSKDEGNKLEKQMEDLK